MKSKVLMKVLAVCIVFSLFVSVSTTNIVDVDHDISPCCDLDPEYVSQ